MVCFGDFERLHALHALPTPKIGPKKDTSKGCRFQQQTWH